MTMTLTKPKFIQRSCGHRVPSGQKKCPYCYPPRLSVEPLAGLLRKRSETIGTKRMSFEIASRLGMDFERVYRHVRRILQGNLTSIQFHTGDRYCVALGQTMPAELWGSEWDDASPVEPYGDEDF